MKLDSSPSKSLQEAQAPFRGSDLLISIGVCIDGECKFDRVEQELLRASRYLMENFQFWEILVIIPVTLRDDQTDFVNNIARLRNTRILLRRPNLDHYASFLLIASESIGDFVIFTNAEEIADVDFKRIWDTADSTGDSVLLRRSSANAFSRLAGTILRKITGYRVDPRMMRTCGHHRARLTSILARSDRELALALATFDGTKAKLVVPDAKSRRFSLKRGFRLLSFTADLLSFAAVRLLKGLAIASCFSMMCALAFTLYALALWLFGANLAEGWLTTSLAISLSTAFMMAAVACLALGIARTLDSLESRNDDKIVGEISATDLFAQFAVLNVEHQGRHAERKHKADA